MKSPLWPYLLLFAAAWAAPAWVNVGVIVPDYDPVTRLLLQWAWAWLLLALAVGAATLHRGWIMLAEYGSEYEESARGQGEAAGGRARAALLVVHGIGVQERFQTLAMVERGLTDGLQRTQWQFEAAGEAHLSRVPAECQEEDTHGRRLRRKGGDQVLDLYECYWAELAEGVLTWREVLSWLGSTAARLPRRMELLVVGSRRLPNPRSVAAPDLRRWVEEANGDIKQKGLYTFAYLAVLLAAAAAVIWLVFAGWRTGVALEDHRVQPEQCPARCTALQKLGTAYRLGREITLVDLGRKSAVLLGSKPGRSLAVLLLTLFFTYFAVHAGAALIHRGRLRRYVRIADLHPGDGRFQREAMRATGRALLGGGVYTIALGLGVYFTHAFFGYSADEDASLLGVTLLLLGAMAVWALVYLGIRPFLSRILADVPVQAVTSAYSKGAEVRRAIHRKMLSLLSQVLREYEAVVVLAHSQGTVVTYEALQDFGRHYRRQQREGGGDLPDVNRLRAYVTIGVALAKVHELVQGLDPAKLDQSTNQVLFDTGGIAGVDQLNPCRGPARWYNYWFLSDLVCNPIRDYLPVDEARIPWHTFGAGAAWTHSDYWDCVDFYERLVADGGALRRAFDV